MLTNELQPIEYVFWIGQYQISENILVSIEF
jgi:hypothetical protein